MPAKGEERIWAACDKVGDMASWRPLEKVVRCRDCVSLSEARDGSAYCGRWCRKVPTDGFCHMGEERGGR